MRDSGKIKMGASGPSPFAISLKFCTSAWVMAPISGVVTKYVARKMDAPTIRFIQLAMFR